MELIDQLNAMIERHALYDAYSALVMMVSGGADSTALLHAFASGKLPSYGALEVLHLNHRLRGREADEDERFVCEAAAKLGVVCHPVNIDVSAYADEHDLNLEDAGRTLRYEQADRLLDTLCSTHQLPRHKGRVVTAHTLDDRIETFFWRALWGAGTGALGSISVQRGHIIRPLLSTTRHEIVTYLSEHGQTWREDATNDDTTRTRAAIRHTLIPVCEQIRPSFRRSLERTMDLAAADNALLERMETAFARDFTVERQEGESIILDARLMRTLEPTMRARTVRSALFETFPEARRIDAHHIDALVDSFDTESFSRDLPFGLRACLNYGTLRISKSHTEQSPQQEDEEHE